MKRIAMATVAVCFIAVVHVMGQTTSTTTSTSTSTSKPGSSSTAKPTASSTTKPTASSTAQPTSKPASKPVLYWDGTGKPQRTDGDAHAEKTGVERSDKWPSPTYEQRESQPADHAMNATGKSGTASQGSNKMVKCTGPEKRPCTEGEVRELSRKMAEKSAEHPALAAINTLTLESSAGALSCRQVNGARCTSEQLKSLNEHVAGPLRCAIYEVVSGSNPASHTSTAQNQTRTTSSYVSTTPSSVSTTSSTTSTTPSTVFTPSSSTSSEQKHTYTTEHHSSTEGNHAPPWPHRTSEWQKRNSTTQSHTSTTGTQNPPASKQP